MCNDDRFVRAGKAFENLCRIMAHLRGPDGCPWDAEQSLKSLKPYLLEEAYEVLDAMDGTAKAHCEELGDLLLQVVFQAEIRNEDGEQGFHAADVADAIIAKLVRRHPHVFEDPNVRNGDEALMSWEAVKALERPEGASVLDGIPRSLPSLLRGIRMGQRAAKIGFDWDDVGGAWEKAMEEWGEVDQARQSGDQSAIEEEFGDLLFALTSVARHLRVDPESALGAALDKFERRFRFVEPPLRQQKEGLQQVPLDVLNRLWEDAKLHERAETEPDP